MYSKPEKRPHFAKLRLGQSYDEYLKVSPQLLTMGAEILSRQVISLTPGSGSKWCLLNRPEAAQTLSHDMIKKTQSILHSYEIDKTAAATLLTSTSASAFCSGIDSIAIAEAAKRRNAKLGQQNGVAGPYPDAYNRHEDTSRQYFRDLYKLSYYLSTMRCPMGVVLQGAALGSGFSFASHARWRGCTPSTVLCLPEVQQGLVPDCAVSHHLARLPSSIGMWLALTGARIKGYQLMHLGLASTCVTSAGDSGEKLEIGVGEVTNHRHYGEDAMERIMGEGHYGPASMAGRGLFDDGLYDFELPEYAFAAHEPLIDKCFNNSVQSVERIVELLQQIRALATEQTWHRDIFEVTDAPDDSQSRYTRMSPVEFIDFTLAQINKASPLSLKIAHRQIKEAARLSVEDTFTMDYRLIQRLVVGEDFHAAVQNNKERLAQVHAQGNKPWSLQSKTKSKPAWKHARLQDVSDAERDSYFAALPNKNEEFIVRPPQQWRNVMHIL